jgi:hypothetical protein
LSLAQVYLETQTEAIVQSIQTLLTSIRSGTQGPKLNDNLTEIIAIVSSIVAICKDNLPTNCRAQGENVLSDLTDNCDRLSELQGAASEGGPAAAAFTKQTKQEIATASFGVAKSLKSLKAILAREGEEEENLV